MMIKIYKLIDPRTNTPFYVGATKTELHRRLNVHISIAKESVYKKRRFIENFMYAQKKNAIILELLSQKLRPLIVECQQVLDIEVNQAENNHYWALTNEGYNLLQDPNRFKYYEQSKSIAKRLCGQSQPNIDTPQ